jgi:hypothetical protein
MFAIVIVCIILASFVLGGFTTAKFFPHNKPSSPKLENADDVLNYLEAASVGQEETIEPLIQDFKNYLTKLNEPKLLPASKKPIWYHSNNQQTPPDEHWKLFFNDLTRESGDDKIDVVRHWVIKLNDHFTLYEIDKIMEQFDKEEDRKKIRHIFAEKNRRDKKEKEKQNVKKP